MAVPVAPTALVAAHGDTTATISFTQVAATPAITNYKYTINDTDYTALSPVDAASPITITGLTNGTEYTIKIKAVNSDGDGAASAAVTVTPSTTPAAPTNLSAAVGDNKSVITFTPGATGGSAITDYEYSVNTGEWKPLGDTASPVTIPGLQNDVESSIRLRAVNANGKGAASAAATVTPTDASAANNDGWTDANSFANPAMLVPNLDWNDPDD